MKSFFTEFILLLKYALLGGLGAFTDFVTYLVLSKFLHIYPVLSNTVSVSLGILVSFILNRKYTFKRFDFIKVRIIRFFLVGLSGLLLSDISIYFMLKIGLNYFLAKIFTLPFVLIYQFVLNRFWSFGRIKG